jgi:hypothetical protein
VRRWLWLAALVIACGDHHDRRLQARYRVGGGARHLLGYHDTKLDLDCNFESYVSGRRHLCVPDDVLGQVYFVDDQCTQPTLPPQFTGYAWIPSSNACTGHPAFFEPGAGSALAGYQLEGSLCMPINARLPTRLPAVTAVPVDESVFASAREVGSSDGQMSLVTDDGTAIPWGGWDGQRAVLPTLTPDGLRWAPWIVLASDGTTFADAICSAAAVDVDTSTVRCPPDGVVVASDGEPAQFFAQGSAVDLVWDTVDGSDGAVCEGPERVTGYAALGSALDPTLSSATIELTGSGALQLLQAVMAGRVVQETGAHQLGNTGAPYADTFVDHASGLECGAYVASDGVTRCMPDPFYDFAFLDGGCQQLVVVDAGSATVSLVGSYGSDGAFHDFAVGSAVAAPTTMYRYDDVGTCAAGSGVAYHVIGDDVPPSRFVELTIEVE